MITGKLVTVSSGGAKKYDIILYYILLHLPESSMNRQGFYH